MNNVICVKWGNLYDADYVNILYAMVKRNVTSPVRFICLTDDPSGIHQDIDIFYLRDKNMRGWWSKIEYFKEQLQAQGPVLAIDLDVFIVDNIDDFFNYEPNNFCMKWDYSGHGHSSCVMRFEANKYNHIYANLNLNEIDHAIDNVSRDFKSHKYWGDQLWITEQLKEYEVKLWPKEWIPKFSIDCHRNVNNKIPFAKLNPRERGHAEFFIPADAKICVLAGAHQRNENLLDKIGEYWHKEDIDL